MTVLEQVELAAHRAGDKLGSGWGMQLFGAFAAELAKITQQEREAPPNRLTGTVDPY